MNPHGVIETTQLANSYTTRVKFEPSQGRVQAISPTRITTSDQSRGAATTIFNNRGTEASGSTVTRGQDGELVYFEETEADEVFGHSQVTGADNSQVNGVPKPNEFVLRDDPSPTNASRVNDSQLNILSLNFNS